MIPLAEALAVARTRIRDEADRVVIEAAERWLWALPILAGDDGPIATRRALFLGGGLMQGKSVDDVVNAAIAAERKEKP